MDHCQHLGHLFPAENPDLVLIWNASSQRSLIALLHFFDFSPRVVKSEGVHVAVGRMGWYCNRGS